jgi:hypothetical protein
VTGAPYPPSARRRPRRRSRTLARIAGGALLLGVSFALGVALGKALDDGPRDRGTVTYVRTLQPLPQEPAPTR